MDRYFYRLEGKNVKDVSAQKEATEQGARLPEQDEHKKRQKGIEEKKA